jgi:hypothetical protein
MDAEVTSFAGSGLPKTCSFSSASPKLCGLVPLSLVALHIFLSIFCAPDNSGIDGWLFSIVRRRAGLASSSVLAGFLDGDARGLQLEKYCILYGMRGDMPKVTPVLNETR